MMLHLTEDEFLEKLEQSGCSEDELMRQMVDEGWTMGRSEDENEWWLDTDVNPLRSEEKE